MSVLNNAYFCLYERLFMPKVLFHMDIEVFVSRQNENTQALHKNFRGIYSNFVRQLFKTRLQKFVSMNVWGIKSVAILRLFSNRNFLDLQIENFWIVECTLDPKEDDNDYNKIKESSKLKFLKSISCKNSYNQYHNENLNLSTVIFYLKLIHLCNVI